MYVQENAELMAGSSLEVALLGHSGDDAMLGHLLGVSGDGKLSLLADATMSNDTAAVLTRVRPPPVVAADGTNREGIPERFLQIVTELFGATLTSEWGPAT